MLNYTDIMVEINGEGYAATQASFNIASPIQPIYSLSEYGVANKSCNSPIKGTFNIDYNIDKDGILDLFDKIVFQDIAGNISPISLSIGEQGFNNAYLVSHGVNGLSNQLVTARAAFDLYFDNINEAIEFGNAPFRYDETISAFAHGASTVGSVGAISDVASFSYDSSIQYEFIFKIGSAIPARTYVNKAVKKITIEGYNISSNISMNGQLATATATVYPLCGSSSSMIKQYSAYGYITELDGSASAGRVGRGKVVVNQFI